VSASIRRNVLVWALGAMTAGAALLLAGFWWLLAHEMDAMFEDNLRQVALAVASQSTGSATALARRATQVSPRATESAEYGKFEFVTQIWSKDGVRLHTSDERVTLPFLSRSGLSLVTAGGERWHLYTIVQDDRIVQAAQRAIERESLARATASALVLPALLTLAAVAGLLALALRRGLAPLSSAAGEVTSRNVEALDPIALDAQPLELHPLVTAINGLMARLGKALAMQRNLVADAAHELRMPIAALRLQLQLLERAGDEAQRRAAVAELRTGIARAQHLVEQLLQLSRLGPDAPTPPFRPLALAALARAAVSEFSARAEQQGIDLGAVTSEAPDVAGDAQQLSVLLNNLVDNALRHTPRGGKVDVQVGADGPAPWVAVADDGPGIPANERQRVFDRFYRSSQGSAGGSSGLGLAIVKAVAERHGAAVALVDAPGGGLRVRVSFPPR
jgi:signal transduction histidine kinase